LHPVEALQGWRMKARALKNALMPDEVDMVSKVTNEASEQLGCDEVVRATIAARVLAFANKGERRYDMLLAIALDKTTR
jgi:hypothetical protein